MRFLIVSIICGLASFGASAQSERAEQMRRIVDGLNSADPITRIITLEEAMASDDSNIKRITLQTAMASSDLTLRTAVMEEIFKTKQTFVIVFKSLIGDEPRISIADKTGGALDLRLANFTPETGDFLAYSSQSWWADNRAGGERVAHPGNFSGDRLTFNLSIGSMDQVANHVSCQATLSLQEGSSIMAGNFACPSGYGTFGVEVDLLK